MVVIGARSGRVFALVLVLLLFTGCFRSGTPAETPTTTPLAVTPPPRDRPADPGRMEAPSPATAATVPTPEPPPEPVIGIGERTVRGRLGPEREFLDVPVLLVPGDVLDATLSSETNLDLILLDRQGDIVRASRNGAVQMDTIKFAVGGPANLTLHVVAALSPLADDAPFTLSVAITRQDDAGTGDDVPEDSPQETGPGTLTGFVGDDDAADAYSFALGPGDALSARMESDGDYDLDLLLVDENGTELRKSRLGPGRPEEIVYAVGYKGPYVIMVVPAITGVQGTYTLTTAVTPPDDAKSGRDAGATLATALDGSQGTVSGFVGDGDAQDHYAFSLLRGQVLIAELDAGLDLDLDVSVRSDIGAEITSSRQGVGRTESLRWRAWDDVNVTVAVDCNKDPAAYRGTYKLTVVVS
ncbi:MAG: hypothetical protein QF415_10175 [Candidatus Undinarchaeales archaeon]|nr:hypothetical protein [Candidatus Undinarchaeales archaeon]MDP7494206.1 hypothetical protein [Candidatus Undinarchaeales archaeon]